MAGIFRTIKDLVTSGKKEPRIPEFIDKPGKGYRGPTPAKAVAKAPAVIEPRVQVLAPVDGRVLALNQVPDCSIAAQHLGAGLAIDSEAGLILAPVDGVVHLPFVTRHAFIITTANQVDILVHIGLDTAVLPEETFQALVEEGEAVKAGQPVVSFDFDAVHEQVEALITCVLVQNLHEHDLVLRPNAGGLGVFAGDDLFCLEVA